MAKYKDGEYIYLHWEDDQEFYPVKGWMDLDHCQTVVNRYYVEFAPKLSSSEHKYAFWGVGMNEMGEPSQMFFDRDDPGRGRFKVTLCYVESRHGS